MSIVNLTSKSKVEKFQTSTETSVRGKKEVSDEKIHQKIFPSSFLHRVIDNNMSLEEEIRQKVEFQKGIVPIEPYMNANASASAVLL